MLNLYWDLCLEPAWYWGGWSHFLEDLFQYSSSPSKGELSGSCLVMAHTLMCTLVRSLALRWELRTWETSVIGPNSNSNTKRDKSNAAFCLDNIEIICNVRKTYFTQIFTRTFYFLRNFGYSSSVLLRKAHSQWLFLRVRVWATAARWAAARVVSTSKGTGECFCSHVFRSLMLHHSLSALHWWV